MTWPSTRSYPVGDDEPEDGDTSLYWHERDEHVRAMESRGALCRCFWCVSHREDKTAEAEKRERIARLADEEEWPELLTAEELAVQEAKERYDAAWDRVVSTMTSVKVDTSDVSDALSVLKHEIEKYKK